MDAPRRRPDVAVGGVRQRSRDRAAAATSAARWPSRCAVGSELAEAQPRRAAAAAARPRPRPEPHPGPSRCSTSGPNAGFTILPPKPPARNRSGPRPSRQPEPPVADLQRGRRGRRLARRFGLRGRAAGRAAAPGGADAAEDRAAGPRRGPPRGPPQARTPPSSSRSSRSRPAQPANPARAWVQIATGERGGLLYTLSELPRAGAGPARWQERLDGSRRRHQPPAGRPVRQRARGPGLRQPAEDAQRPRPRLDKRRRAGDRPASDRQ